MKTLIALCDTLDCTPSDLIEPYVAANQRPKSAAAASVTELNPDFRPARARITDDPPGPSR